MTYGCWFTIIVVGIATAMGKDVHPGWDMVRTTSIGNTQCSASANTFSST